MKLLKCPRGYVGTKVNLNGAWLDIYIDLAVTEERGYTLVDDTIARILLDRPGYEVIRESDYPRPLEVLKERVGKELLTIGILTGEPITSVNLDALPKDTQQHIGQAQIDQEPAQTQKQSLWNRWKALFRR